MRICYIADGRSMHFHRWISFFKNQGCQISFVSYQPVSQAHIEAIEKAGGTFLGEIGPFYIKRFWRTVRDLFWLRRVLRQEKISAIHCHFLGVNAWYAALSGFRPFILTIMGGGDVCGPTWKPQGVIEKLLTPFSLHRADVVTSWSHQIARVVRPYCREKVPVEVLHGGIDLNIFKPGPKPGYLLKRLNIPLDAKVVFSPRLMRPLSNIDQIAESVDEVIAVNPNTCFLFVCPVLDKDAAYEAKVRKIASRSRNVERVRFLDTIPHAEIADYYRLADVTISIPSTDGTPMSVLESMACQTPVVVGDIPDYDPDYFEPGKTVLAVRTDDPRSIAQAITRLLDGSDLALNLSKESYDRVIRDGSINSQMNHMHALYKVALGV